DPDGGADREVDAQPVVRVVPLLRLLEEAQRVIREPDEQGSHRLGRPYAAHAVAPPGDHRAPGREGGEAGGAGQGLEQMRGARRDLEPRPGIEDSVSTEQNDEG